MKESWDYHLEKMVLFLEPKGILDGTVPLMKNIFKKFPIVKENLKEIFENFRGRSKNSWMYSARNFIDLEDIFGETPRVLCSIFFFEKSSVIPENPEQIINELLDDSLNIL